MDRSVNKERERDAEKEKKGRRQREFKRDTKTRPVRKSEIMKQKREKTSRKGNNMVRWKQRERQLGQKAHIHRA